MLSFALSRVVEQTAVPTVTSGCFVFDYGLEFTLFMPSVTIYVITLLLSGLLLCTHFVGPCLICSCACL